MNTLAEVAKYPCVPALASQHYAGGVIQNKKGGRTVFSCPEKVSRCDRGVMAPYLRSDPRFVTRLGASVVCCCFGNRFYKRMLAIVFQRLHSEPYSVPVVLDA